MSHNKTPPSLFGHIAELGRTVSGNDLDVGRKNSWFSGETCWKSTPIPNPGEVLATSPFNRNLVSPNHNATSNLVSTRSGMGISTKQPPRPKSETLHHITGCPTRCNSAAMEHFTRGDWRRSLSAKRKLSITPDGKGKSQNGFSGVRLSSPIWPPLDSH